MPQVLPGIGAAAGMMRRQLTQVTFGAAGAGAATTTGTLSLPYPSGIVAGSFLAINTYVIGSSEHGTPSGWTRVPQSLAESVTIHEAYYRRADGSETGSLNITITGDGDAFGRMYRFSHGIGIEANGDFRTIDGDTTVEAINITTLGPKRMAVQLMTVEVNTTIGAITGESGADYTEAVAEFTGNSPGTFCMSCQVAQVASASAITGGSATLGADANIQNVIGFAIVP